MHLASDYLKSMMSAPMEKQDRKKILSNQKTAYYMCSVQNEKR
jgi:hypothetical protein